LDLLDALLFIVKRDAGGAYFPRRSSHLPLASMIITLTQEGGTMHSRCFWPAEYQSG
jgi:hypothetical protein